MREGRVMNNISTFMFCREDVLKSGGRTGFSPARWHKQYIKNNRFKEAVYDLMARFEGRFALCEEYSVWTDRLGEKKVTYRFVVVDENGCLGFLFQLEVADLRPAIKMCSSRDTFRLKSD